MSDLEAAAAMYDRACAAREMHGCYLLGMMLYRGEGVAQDTLRARELLGAACRASIDDACAFPQD